MNIKKIFDQKKYKKNFFPTEKKLGIRLHEPTYDYKEINSVIRTLLSSNLTFGKKTKYFENKFERLIKTKNALYVNSGSSANLLALSTLTNPYLKNHLKPGDEVIVPALSWSTSVWPIIQNNLTPVFVDIEKESMNIDPKNIEKAISKKTKAILIIHTYGNACDMKEILRIKKKYKLFLIEDTCEALGTEYNKQYCGTFGDIGTYSFYFSHHITTGEGGMMITNNTDISNIANTLRAHGWVRNLPEKEKIKYEKKYKNIDKKFLFINLGYNLRGSEIGASIGIEQLKKFRNIILKRRKIAQQFINFFQKNKFFSLQKETKNSSHSWFGLPIYLNKKINLNKIRKYLDSKNVETRPIICGNITNQPALKKFKYKIKGSLKNSNFIMKNAFAIGCHQNISYKNINYTKKIINNALNKQ